MFHRAYGRTSVDRIIKSITAADYSQLDDGNRSKLQGLQRKCESCQYNSSSLKQFLYRSTTRGTDLTTSLRSTSSKLTRVRYSMLSVGVQVSLLLGSSRNERQLLKRFGDLSGFVRSMSMSIQLGSFDSKWTKTAIYRNRS
jgi:hypothetical protein